MFKKGTSLVVTTLGTLFAKLPNLWLQNLIFGGFLFLKEESAKEEMGKVGFWAGKNDVLEASRLTTFTRRLSRAEAR